MRTAWVVDSNCFIHLGQKADDRFVTDLRAALEGGKLLITPGVEQEVATVGFRRHKGRPRVLTSLASLLHSIPVDDASIRALATRIGESAAPQDVDLSLMVLADDLGAEGASVTLVSDDFKMTTTAERAGLRFTTCPPSTFVERLGEGVPNKDRDARFRRLSRQVRAAEMKYAISRRDEYDVQRKLTWMVDSLLASNAMHSAMETEDADQDEGANERRRIADLTRSIRGYSIKRSRLEALGHLPTICAPVSRLDTHLETLRGEAEEHLPTAVATTSRLLTDVMEEVGLGLAPLGEEEAKVAHRAMAGSLLRTESALGLMARMSGHHDHARRHLARALHLATLVDDVGAERKAMHRLGMLALHAGDASRALRLFVTASEQPVEDTLETLPSVVMAAICSTLNGDLKAAREWVERASLRLISDPAKAGTMLEACGDALLSIDRPDLALELFDEAMECAELTQDSARLETLRTNMVQAELALDDSDYEDLPDLRAVLDDLIPTAD